MNAPRWTDASANASAWSAVGTDNAAANGASAIAPAAHRVYAATTNESARLQWRAVRSADPMWHAAETERSSSRKAETGRRVSRRETEGSESNRTAAAVVLAR